MTDPSDPRDARTRTLDLRGGKPRPTAESVLASGARVADFTIDEARFEGGFAVVYRAHDDAGHAVALKVLRPHLAASRSMAERFAREAEMLRRLHHPHIVEYLGAGVLASGQPYLAMEWLDGHDLGVHLAERGPLTLAEAVAVLEQLVEALAAAHALGLVHRDLKAQNVMVLASRASLTIKLVDFGIAKQLHLGESSTGSTSSSVMLGTPLNMAPEQILGGAIDARTDVYALGLLAHQLVTGRLPFHASTYVEIEELHLNAPPPRASQIAPVPAAFDALVARCLRKSPAERFADVGAFLVAARGLLGGAPARVPVHVTAHIGGALDDIDDAAFDDVDAALELARATFSAEGAEITVESGTALVVAASDAATARALAERVRAQLLARPDPHPLVRIDVSSGE